MSNISVRRPPRAESHMAVSSSLDAQRVKTEFMSQIQAVVSRQDAQMRQLDAQLLQLDHELKPKIQNVERQQSLAQQQVEDTRTKVQSISSNEITPLQNQLDQLSTKFDRFVKTEIEAKLKPMQEELRQSRTKVDELVTLANSSFKRLSDQVRDLSDKVNTASEGFEADRDRISTQLDELRPTVMSLRGQADDLRESIEAEPPGPKPEEIAAQIDKIERTVKAIEMDELPRQVQESNEPFVQVINDLKSYCASKASEFEKNIAVISKNTAALDAQRKKADESIKLMIQESMELQKQIVQSEKNAKAKIAAMENRYDSAMQSARTRMSEISDERDRNESALNTQGKDAVNVLKQQLQNTLRMVKESLKDATTENRKAQEIALQQITKIRTELEGEEGLMARIQRIEEQVDYCIDSITEVHKRRSKMQKAGGDANVLGRIANLEARLGHAESRLSTVDGKPAPRRPKFTTTVERVSPVPAEAEASKDSQVKPPPGRELPRPGDKVFSENSSSRRRNYEPEDDDDYRHKKSNESSPGDSLRRRKRR